MQQRVNSEGSRDLSSILMILPKLCLLNTSTRYIPQSLQPLLKMAGIPQHDLIAGMAFFFAKQDKDGGNGQF